MCRHRPREDLLNDFEIHIGREISVIAGLLQDGWNPFVPLFDAGVPVGLADVGMVVERGHQAAHKATPAGFAESLGP